RVAAHRRGIAVAFHRPGAHHLAARLAHRRELAERSLDRKAGLLAELALRRVERVLAFRIFALRDRPRAFVAVLPEGTARMDEEHFEASRAAAIEENSGAAAALRPARLRHACADAGNMRTEYTRASVPFPPCNEGSHARAGLPAPGCAVAADCNRHAAADAVLPRRPVLRLGAGRRRDRGRER